MQLAAAFDDPEPFESGSKLHAVQTLREFAHRGPSPHGLRLEVDAPLGVRLQLEKQAARVESAATMKIIRCDEGFSAPILAILNDAIVHSTALYDYKPRTAEMMAAWFRVKQQGNYPVLGAVNDAGELMGFASYGTFRAWPAYKYSVEHSVYVAAPFRGQGLGKRLLGEIIAAAQEQAYHVLVGAIDSENAVSIRLHERLGFTHAGTLRQAGFKFGRWLDLALYQRILPTPAEPKDG